MNEEYVNKCEEIFEKRCEILVQKNISDFIFSFEKMLYKEDIDLGIVETKFSPSFLNALKNYKK